MPRHRHDAPVVPTKSSIPIKPWLLGTLSFVLVVVVSIVLVMMTKTAPPKSVSPPVTPVHRTHHHRLRGWKSYCSLDHPLTNSCDHD